MSKPTSSKHEIWRSLLHVRPLPDATLDLGSGAYAWVLALAGDGDEYCRRVSSEMKNLGLFIVDFEQLQRFDPSQSDDDETRDCLARISDECPVQYNNFYAYPHDDA